MADISITKYKTKVTKPTASPSNPGYPTSDPIDPVNPPASGAGGGGVNTFLQLTDTPATYTGQAGLFPKVNSGETALEFFNPLSLPLTGYTVGSNTALADTDTILGAFGKVQGQINAKIGGSGTGGQVAYFDSINSIASESAFGYLPSSNCLNVGVLTNPETYPHAANNASFVLGSLSGNTILSIVSQNNAVGFINFSDGNVGNDRIRGVIFYNHADNSMRFLTDAVERIRITSGGLIGIGNIAPTNTLDVNGTARIRSVANGTGNFATYSATGVLQHRTAAEVVSDLSTDLGLTYLRKDIVDTKTRRLNINGTASDSIVLAVTTTLTNSTELFTATNGASIKIASIRADGFSQFTGSSNSGTGLLNITNTSTGSLFQASNNSGVALRVTNNGSIQFFLGGNIITDTTTGTKIGTATTQKLAFWNATPIVQPTTAVTGATLVGGGGTTITDTDTFDGYTLAQVVKALRNIGLLA